MFIKTEEEIEIKAVSLKSFGDWLNGILIEFFQVLQSISIPLFMILFGIGGLTLFIGALLGSSRMRGAGLSSIILGIVAALIVFNAPTIIGILEGFTQRAP